MRETEKKLMDSLENTLNDLLVKLFKDLMEIEGKSLITEEFSDITNNDMHIIEAIGVDDPQKSSVIAKRMSITMGTLTKAIDGLSRKGYVERRRSESDKRVIRLCLTDKGRLAYYHHEQFHRQMIENIKEGLPEEEMTVLIGALAKLTDYFQSIYFEESKENQYKDWLSISEDNK